MTGTHWLLESLLNDEPATHGEQPRSDDAVGAVVTPVPATQLCKAAQTPLPPTALNVTPATHAVHSRSVESVGAVVLANPAPQFVTVWHAFTPPAPNVNPSVQLPHTQFDVLDGGASGSLPATHGTIALQLVWPAWFWYCVVPSHATQGVAASWSVSAVPKGQSGQLPYAPIGVYVPALQLMQGVSGFESVSLVPAPHVVHMRSLVAEAATV